MSILRLELNERRFDHEIALVQGSQLFSNSKVAYVGHCRIGMVERTKSKRFVCFIRTKYEFARKSVLQLTLKHHTNEIESLDVKQDRIAHRPLPNTAPSFQPWNDSLCDSRPRMAEVRSNICTTHGILERKNEM